jgi:hypothetical protein
LTIHGGLPISIPPNLRAIIVKTVCTVGAVAALGWLLVSVGWGMIESSLQRVGFAGAAILVLCAVAESVCDGAALRAVMTPAISRRLAIISQGAGAFFNTLLPFESGEVIKIALLRRHLGTANSISGVGQWNYLFKLTRPVVSSIAGVLAVVIGVHTNGRAVSAVVIANACAFLPFLLLRWGVRSGSIVTVAQWLQKIGVVRSKSRGWLSAAITIDGKLRGFWAEHRLQFAQACLWQGLARIFNFLALYLLLKWLRSSLTLADILLIYAAMNVVEYLAAVFPAKLGPVEGLAYFAFSFLGHNPALGVIVYVLMRLKSVLGNGMLAPLTLLDTSEIRRAPLPSST